MWFWESMEGQRQHHNTIYHGTNTRNLVSHSPWLSAPGPGVFLVVESLAYRAEEDAILGSGGREPEEVKMLGSGSMVRLTSWGITTLFSPSLRLQFWGGTWALGWRSPSEEEVLGSNHRCRGPRDGERVKLGILTQLREKKVKKRKAYTALFPFFSFFFSIYTMEKPPWRCCGRACTGPALRRCRCVWGGSCFLPGPSHTLSSQNLLQAGCGFLSPASPPG